jgi:hypothetical protein
MSIDAKCLKIRFWIILFLLHGPIAAANWVKVSPYPILPTANLYGVWVSPDNQVFAAGAEGVVIRYDGQTWSQMESPVPGGLGCVWGRSASDVFVVSGRALLHYDGEGWRAVPGEAQESITSLWGFGDEVFGVTMNGQIFRSHGSALTTVYLASEVLLSIWGFSEHNIYAAGANGLLLHFDGDEWSRIPSGRNENFRGIWSASDHDLYIVGDSGILYYDGRTFSEMDTPPGNYSLIWGTSQNNIYAWMIEGQLLHFNGAGWQVVESLSSESVTFINGNAENNVYAVGTNGLIERYDGQNWEKVSRDEALSLVDVWGRGENDIFAVGNKGRVVHYNGNGWTEMVTPTGSDLSSVWGRPGEKMIAVGQNGTIIESIGNSWTMGPVLTDQNLTDVFGSSGNNIFAVGNGGTVLHSDGIGWTRIVSATSHDFVNVWVDQDGRAFIISRYFSDKDRGDSRLFPIWGGDHIIYDLYRYSPASGLELLYEGISWNAVISGISNDAFVLDMNNNWGVSMNDMFSVGTRITHFDGQDTAEMRVDLFGAWLAGVWGTPNKGVYAVGSGEAIFYYPLSGIRSHPKANAGSDKTVNEGDTVTLDGSLSSDPANEIVAYQWKIEKDGEDQTARLSDPKDISPTFKAPEIVGRNYEPILCTLEVENSAGILGSDEMTITVNNLLDPPIAEAGEDFAAIEGHLVTLDGSGSWDSETGVWFYSWEQIAGPPVVTKYDTLTPPYDFTNPSIWFIAPRNEDADTLVFRLTVKNMYDLAATDDISVTIMDSPVEPPVADAGGNLAAYDHDPLILDGSGAYDPNGGRLTYEWRVIPKVPIPYLLFNVSNPVFYVDGWYGLPVECILIVTNEDGLKAADKITLDVLPSDAPHERPTLVAAAGPDQVVTEGDMVALDASGSCDPFADTVLAYTWEQIDGPEVTLTATDGGLGASFVAPPVEAEGDRLVFRLTVSNGYGLQGEDEISVEVIDKAASSGGSGEGACFISVGLLAW